MKYGESGIYYSCLQTVFYVCTGELVRCGVPVVELTAYYDSRVGQS